MPIVRTIQWFGLLRLPLALKNVKNYQIYFDLLRYPKQPYVNRKFPEPRGFFGYMQLLYSGRVVDTLTLEYERQVVLSAEDDGLYLHASISCHLEAVLTSFLNVGNYLQPGYTIQRNNPIKDWTNFRSPRFDEIAVRLADEFTTANITFDWESVDICTVPDSELPEEPKDNPPIPPIEVEDFDAPNSALPPISPAYDGNDDGGRTYKPDPDTDPDFETEECAKYAVIFIFDRLISVQGRPPEFLPGNEQTASLYGRIGAITSETDSTSGRILISSQGYSFAECQAQPLNLIVWEEQFVSGVTSFEYRNVRIVNIIRQP